MIALIPGLTTALGYLKTGEPAPSNPREVFSGILEAAAPNPSSPETSKAAGPPRYVVQAGENLTLIAKKLGYQDPLALAHANNLKNPDRLHAGQVLVLPEDNSAPALGEPTRLARGRAIPVEAGISAAAGAAAKNRRLVTASWYGSQHHGKLMANGRPFDMYADTAAHKNLPLGTYLTLINPKTGTSVKVQVTDRGPFVPGRNLDLSYGAARKLGVVQSGVVKLWMEEG